MIISRTPFRISFLGGGTDYPSWYRQHGGAVLGTTIDKYCYLTCRYLPPFFAHRSRVVWSKIELCGSNDEITHPAAREVLRFLKISRGVEVHHEGDLPARSGMGSSSAFTVGLLHALYALKGIMPTREKLAKEGILIEREVLRETVGVQDQIFAAHGGFHHITLHENDEFTLRPMTLSADRVKELNAHLMLFFTGIARTASRVAKSYVPDLSRKEPVLNRIAGLVGEGISVLNARHDLKDFGRLLHEYWRLKSELSSKVSTSSIEEIYREALASGATGGKLMGAGGGGFMVLFVPPRNQKKVRERLRRLIYVPFQFESSGSQVIFCDREEDFSSLENIRTGGPGCAFRKATGRRRPRTQ
jgi:D-glycero-alpha-D-manno-heptose-7-phosphate kinase